MAELPIKCEKCGKIILADSERNNMKCPECDAFVSIARAIKKEHPKWIELLEEEKELYERSRHYKPGMTTSERKTLSPKILRMLIMAGSIALLVVGSRYWVMRGFADTIEGDVIYFIILAIVAFAGMLVGYLMPTIMEIHKGSKERKAIDEMQDKIAQRISEIIAEKEEYIKEAKSKAGL